MATKPWTVTITGNSSTYGYPTYVTDYSVSPVNIGYGVTFNSTAASCTLQYTFDSFDQATFVSTGLTWFASTTALSTSGIGNLSIPCTAVRPNVTSASSLGTITVRLVQAG
jgi:hypothetical protein